MVPCKEQAGNRGTWPAVVFYSRGLRSPLAQAPEDWRFRPSVKVQRVIFFRPQKARWRGALASAQQKARGGIPPGRPAQFW
jgi:hypothetical protein